MTDPDGKGLAEEVLTKMGEFIRACEGLDEESSSRAPEGRWSPRQIISHLCGAEGVGHLPLLKTFIEQDTPEIDLIVEDPFWSASRSRMSLAGLLSEFEQEYVSMAEYVGGLSGEELSRKARIPALRESPLGEYPTLAQFVSGLATFHIGFHTEHLQEIKSLTSGAS